MTTTKQAQTIQDDAAALATSALRHAETEIVTLVSSADTLTIKTAEELGASTDLLQTVKERQKALTDMRLSITRPMDDAKKRVMELFQPAVDRLKTAEQTIKLAVLTYTKEQARLQREEQARLDAEAERERLRLATLSDKQRAAGRDDRAEATEERAAEVQAPTVAVAEAPTGAVHLRTTWHAEVTDLQVLAKAYVEHPERFGSHGGVCLDVILPNMKVLNELARTQKGDLAIPGVKAVAEEGVSARAG